MQVGRREQRLRFCVSACTFELVKRTSKASKSSQKETKEKKIKRPDSRAAPSFPLCVGRSCFDFCLRRLHIVYTPAHCVCVSMCTAYTKCIHLDNASASVFVPLHQLLRQYLYFCTNKKLSTCKLSTCVYTWASMPRR
jgi:hypothetical protein